MPVTKIQLDKQIVKLLQKAPRLDGRVNYFPNSIPKKLEMIKQLEEKIANPRGVQLTAARPVTVETRETVQRINPPKPKKETPMFTQRFPFKHVKGYSVNYKLTKPITADNQNDVMTHVKKAMKEIVAGNPDGDNFIKLTAGRGSNSRTWSQSFKIDANTIKEIEAALKKLKGKHFVDESGDMEDGGPDYVASITNVSGVSVNGKSGGCQELNTKKIEDIELDEKVIASIYSVKSKNNNCLFASINTHYEIKGNVYKADDVRTKLGIEHNTEIDINQIDMIIKQYNKDHNRNISCVLYGANKQIKKVYGVVDDDSAHILLTNGHYYLCKLHVEKNVCEKCGKHYANKHTCDANRVNFYQKQIRKKQFVDINYVDRYKKQEKTIEKDSVVIFDFETFQAENMIKHTVYCAAWKCGDAYYCEYGPSCMDKFIEYILSVENKTFIAYNGSGFDFYILINEFINRQIETRDMLLSNGKLMKLTFGNNNNFFDLCLFTSSSLADACDSFKITNCKTSFDHNKIKGWHSTELYKDEVIEYIKYDILSLEELFYKLRDELMKIDDNYKFDILKFVTVSHMAYDIWTSKLNTETFIEIPKDVEKYNFILQSVYGGRCYPMQQQFQSKNYDDIMSGKVTYDKVIESNDYVFPADVSSLYPSAMKGTEHVEALFPSGSSSWSQNAAADYKAGKLGVFEINYKPRKDLVVPILPKKIDGCLIWDLKDGNGCFTSVDIKNAEDAGYEIEILKGLVYESACNPFKEYVSFFYELKRKADEEKNDVMRSLAKLFLNALYGKMLQQAKNEELVICKKMHDFTAFMARCKITDFEHVGDYLMLKGEKHNFTECIKKPSQLGAFVLSYSRRIMLHFLKAMDETLTQHTFYYTDTDSIYIAGEYHKKLIEQKLCVLKSNSYLGILCGDLKKEGVVVNAKFLGPKCYCYEYINNENKVFGNDNAKIACKGIPLYDPKFKSSDEKEEHKLLCIDDFRKATPKVVEFSGLKKKNVSLTKDEKETGMQYFSIVNNTQTRTFLLSTWKGFDLLDNKYYPRK